MNGAVWLMLVGPGLMTVAVVRWSLRYDCGHPFCEMRANPWHRHADATDPAPDGGLARRPAEAVHPAPDHRSRPGGPGRPARSTLRPLP